MTVLIHINISFPKKELRPFKISASTSDSVFAAIKRKLKNSGFSIIDETKILNQNNEKITSGNICDFIEDGSLFVVYNNIIAPYGAKFYDEYEGNIYYFHTAESSHKNYPHVHVINSSEEISIYLKTNRIIGEFKNKKAQRRALEYVSKNRYQLLNEWDNITSKY
ncbi:MAG: DUF4160 domain-containing protein [Clostridia bacterium]|nr:DUF4160 domain-containing protein [Clostridia bacterium]